MDDADLRRFDPASLIRPDPALLTYYVIVSVMSLVFFPLVFPPLYFKYKSLRYRIDDEGVSMSWGVLFRREVYLTYRRLQDIQMTRGVIQRKLGLAELHLHTASGSAGAEMKLEGITKPEAFRDFLYARMQGGRAATMSPLRTGLPHGAVDLRVPATKGSPTPPDLPHPPRVRRTRPWSCFGRSGTSSGTGIRQPGGPRGPVDHGG